MGKEKGKVSACENVPKERIKRSSLQNGKRFFFRKWRASSKTVATGAHKHAKKNPTPDQDWNKHANRMLHTHAPWQFTCTCISGFHSPAPHTTPIKTTRLTIVFGPSAQGTLPTAQPWRRPAREQRQSRGPGNRARTRQRQALPLPPARCTS